MAFSDSIRALLDTYANCISLLKSFRLGRNETDTVGIPHQHSHLRKSLRSDRSLIERAYSSRLSALGKRFKIGDARAITALDRILKRLRDAVTHLLRLSTKQNDFTLDCESLMSLSNASRADAIKAIDSLSRRLGSPSRSSVVSSSSKGSSNSPSTSRYNRKLSAKAGVSGSKPTPRTRQKNLPSKRPLADATKEDKAASRQRKAGDAARPRKGPSVQPLGAAKRRDTHSQDRFSRAMAESRESPKSTVDNRRSILSFSSGSTKLGEIPQRKWQSVAQYTATDPDGDEYNVRPVFPLKPYTVEVKERRFLGLFSRKREL
ncbi:uncharacterized protein THITE_2107408 [Thermothielavioides terrestris NRRL 8126]|uniref:Uncharacterized protein n=1 Tax=Thermothielavioides terrestris (strain ATCC 38088 / NRRL 8126) TaxID=578455 RepID=G2QTT8_THETT|nr:uncharacterized protein THITE_2107408 [Thermothielavioides terrestris NRRL 8126]AEO62798.1 hypothetical protein THITE_2107408 [Thermothielavioides terrestris NRRL 8126]